jgi:hypothetical protein
VKSSDPGGSQSGQTLPTPATLPQDPGYTHPADAESLNQSFRILSDFVDPWLPMAQTAEEIAGPIGDITWDPSRAQAFIDGGLEAGMEYTVRSRIVVPTPEELDQVDHRAPQAYGRWTELPADLDPRIGEIAERWTWVSSTTRRTKRMRTIKCSGRIPSEGFWDGLQTDQYDENRSRRLLRPAWVWLTLRQGDDTRARRRRHRRSSAVTCPQTLQQS